MTLGDMTDGTVSCADVGSLAIGQFTIDTTGAMVAYNTGTFTEPSCAPFRLSGTGGFAGNQFGASLNATAPSGSGGDCGAFNLTATLTH
jgi:hypothetical protein